MSKKQIKRDIRRLSSVKTWQLVVVLFLLVVLSATFLRLNNIGMIERREAVLEADKQGDSQVIRERLYDLQRHVAAHMNSHMGAIYLEHQYDRDSKQLIEDASKQDSSGDNVYKKAQEVCEPRFSSYSQAYLQCTLDELEKYSPAGELKSTVKLPNPGEYRHSYESPFWSPDFAGFSVLAAVAVAAIIVVRLVGLLVLHMLLKRQNRGI